MCAKIFFNAFVCGMNGVSKKIKQHQNESLSYLSLSFYFISFINIYIYIHVSIFFSSGVAFHRPLIFFFLLLYFWVHLQIVSCSLVFLMVSRQNSYASIIFFWRHFNLPIWVGLRKTVYSLHHGDVCPLWDLSANWLVWFFLLTYSTFPLPHITWVSWPIGIQPSNISLVPRSHLSVHIRMLGKLDRQSVSLHPWPEFNSSDFSSTFAGLRRK